MSKRKIKESVLSDYEKGILNGKRPEDDVRTEMTRKVLENQLSQEITVKLPDGSTITATALEMAVAGAIGDMISKPSVEKLLTLQKLRGEIKESPTEVVISKVDEDLEKRAIE